MPSATFNESSRVFTIPAQHTNRLRSILKGTQAAPVPLERIRQQVFSADYREIHDVPAAVITHLGSDQGRATRLVMCANYDPAVGTESCMMGARCKFVHADLRDVPVGAHSIHINYAYRDVAFVDYPRYPSGKLLEVHAPAAKGSVVDVMDSGRVLRTQALEVGRTPLCHCAHYYFNRTCNLGAECQFIHAIFVDPNAKPYQRAPAPRTLGRRGVHDTRDAGATEDRTMTPDGTNDDASSAAWLPSCGSFGDLTSRTVTPVARRQESMTPPSLPSWASGAVSPSATPGARGESAPEEFSEGSAAAPLPLSVMELESTLQSRGSFDATSPTTWTPDRRRFRHNPYGHRNTPSPHQAAAVVA